MKTQNHSIAKSGKTADSKKSTLALNTDLSSLRGAVSAVNNMNVTSTKAFATSTVISVVDGHKGVPIAADALFLRASDLAHASSTASESDLLSCGLTPDELEDLQVKSTAVSFSETQKIKPAWQS
ncbi:hypothetical protein Ndes2526B_g06104 [Nannochloris sp. 'desiccata']|nr:hypothetical protein KSW81_007898 [Chlorella desiccata (nom. nud.)]KAH7619151.1 hypothetical protein NADE_005996 [Chlorella desiccata (nom. nud.)]